MLDRTLLGQLIDLEYKRGIRQNSNGLKSINVCGYINILIPKNYILRHSVYDPLSCDFSFGLLLFPT